MSAERKPRVMDNPYYDWSPLTERAPLRWPSGARVAFCVVISLEKLELFPPEDLVVPPSAVLIGAYPKVFDIHELSHHEYGNRVGIFRVMRTLDARGIRATVAMDAELARANPFLVKECLQRDWELIGHGISFSQMITELIPEQEERGLIREALDTLEETTGQRPVGWVGADYGESTRTVSLLAELGVRYVCDWPNDEQPYRMKVPVGEIVSLPVTLDLDEVYTHRMRTIPTPRWCQMVTEAFDRLYGDGASNGRLLVLNLHPYLIGQPFRIKYLDRALAYIMRHEDVWAATGREIVNWYLEQAGGPAVQDTR